MCKIIKNHCKRQKINYKHFKYRCTGCDWVSHCALTSKYNEAEVFENAVI